MGKGKRKKEPVSGTKKELVIVTRHVVTLDQVKNDERKMRLLAVFKALEDVGGIYERSLAHLLYWLKTEKNLDLGYNFIVVGGTPTSKELHEDLVALLYVGLIESNPRTKKLQLTSEGKEFLDKVGLPPDWEKIKQAVEELKPKVTAIDAQLELTAMLMRPRAPRRRMFI